MIKIHSKILSDLEFPAVCTQLSTLCICDKGKERALRLKPYKTKEDVYFGLNQTQEYVNSALEEKPIPNHGFDPLDKELKLLTIEETVLEIGSFRKIKNISETVNTLLSYFEKYQESYPTLYATVQDTEHTSVLIDEINTVVDRFGEIRDDASSLLQRIRSDINRAKGKINSSFGKALAQYASYGYLDEIRESVVENVRVLAVNAMHRRKVKGTILGNSKTGSIVYVQPEETYLLQRELNNLEFEEKEEIKRILKALTEFVRPFRALLISYQEVLTTVDVISAKAKYAKTLNAVKPKLSENRELELKEAYHPLLLVNNNRRNEKTYPQDISLNAERRIIVISGPNAGGKSITLKTVGLLQVMLQSGLLIPVHEYSRVCLFNKVLTDIGDNQSIENHLSTYSYRLKNMRHFLRQCDDNTLLLIDEFGTGSDPELGGALAETFLEVFHERGSYGIITTHYANLKMMANETEGIINANMLFDPKTLKPLFKLHMGEAGSSFTFEVAQKNGIPFSLINRSKKKVERGKIRFDKSIAKLQQERNKLAKTNTSLKTKEQKTVKQQQELDKINSKIQQKLENYQELYDSNQRMIYLGQKLDDLSEKFFYDKNKKKLMGELLKVVQIENSKRIKQENKKRKAERAKAKKVQAEAQKKVETIREKKKAEKKAQQIIEEAKPKVKLKIGDRVRLPDGKAVGSIDAIEKGKAIVNYGMFTTNVDIDKLEFVQEAKNKRR